MPLQQTPTETLTDSSTKNTPQPFPTTHQASSKIDSAIPFRELVLDSEASLQTSETKLQGELHPLDVIKQENLRQMGLDDKISRMLAEVNYHQSQQSEISLGQLMVEPTNLDLKTDLKLSRSQARSLGDRLYSAAAKKK